MKYVLYGISILSLSAAVPAFVHDEVELGLRMIGLSLLALFVSRVYPQQKGESE